MVPPKTMQERALLVEQRIRINEINGRVPCLRISYTWTRAFGERSWYDCLKELTHCTWKGKKEPCGGKEFVPFFGWQPQDSSPISSIWSPQKSHPWLSWRISLDVALCEVPDGPSVMSSLPRYLGPPAPSNPSAFPLKYF